MDVLRTPPPSYFKRDRAVLGKYKTVFFPRKWFTLSQRIYFISLDVILEVDVIHHISESACLYCFFTARMDIVTVPKTRHMLLLRHISYNS